MNNCYIVFKKDDFITFESGLILCEPVIMYKQKRRREKISVNINIIRNIAELFLPMMTQFSQSINKHSRGRNFVVNVVLQIYVCVLQCLEQHTIIMVM